MKTYLLLIVLNYVLDSTEGELIKGCNRKLDQINMSCHGIAIFTSLTLNISHIWNSCHPLAPKTSQF
jgi:hypothetical protein